jgi:hypothetical protein
MNEANGKQLRALIEEAKLRVTDLTRELDESMRAEQEEAILTELQRARERVIALERSLARAEGDGR